MQLCTGFNDCKFVITPTGNLASPNSEKHSTKIPKKSLNAKNSNKELSSFEDRKVHTNFCYGGRKSFVTWQIQCHCSGGAGGPNPHLGLQKIRFFEHHVRSRKPTMMQNVVVTFNPTYLIKVTYISSILKFLNTVNLVVQVSNTKLNIQSLHL